MIGLAALPLDAAAQTYPERPVKMIVPYTPGGLADGAARVLVQGLTRFWSQPVVIENRPGADGGIGSELVARAAPDGYTLLFAANGPLVINPALYANLRYDPARDFAPITIVYWSPQVLIVPPMLPVNSVAELIAYIKGRPGKLNFSSAGIGSPPHLAGELFKIGAGLDVVHVPYKGGPEMTTAVMTGDVAYNFTGLNVMPLVRSGKVKVLAVSSAIRSALAPDLPTIAASGIPGYEVSVWGGVLAPAKTPQDIVLKVHADMTRVLSDPESKPKFNAVGLEPVGNKPEEFAAQIKAETVRWAGVIKSAGIQPH
ncbi:MAG: tripartite tricarboxylate transporter substrate binding protein [Betaproteobacteria bacterium]|nr:tripartite tricarboxylate transporter substrate binding protein [Betaproteobacteria bacterium]